MAVRKFKIINANNEVLDLMDKDSFGYNPEGLGVSFDNSYYSAGPDFLDNELKYSMAKVSYYVALGYVSKDPYPAYSKMVSVLSKTPLTLQYDVPDVGTFSRDVRVKDIDKSEIDKASGILISKLELDCLTPWYSWEQFGNMEPRPWTEGLGKLYADYFNAPPAPVPKHGNQGYGPSAIYSFAYDNYNRLYGPSFKPSVESDNPDYISRIIGPSSIYPYTYQDERTVGGPYVDIQNKSELFGEYTGTPIKVLMKAVNSDITDVSWSVRTIVNSNKYGNVKINATIPKGYSLQYSSDYRSRSIMMYNNLQQAVSDLTNYLDPSSSGFMLLAEGESELQLSDSIVQATGGFNTGNVVVSVKQERMTV